MTFMLALFGDCDILFSVMRDRIELEEVFVSEEVAGVNAPLSDTWHQRGSCPSGTKSEHVERVRRQAKAQAGMFWFLQKRRQQGDWS
jgi:hypothetical protein